MAIRERAGSAATPAASTSFPRFESYPYDQSIGLVLRSAFLRASRRTATCKIVPASILRDAVLRTAPQDEVWGIEFHSVRYDRFHGIDALGIALETFWGGVAAASKLQAEVAQRAGVGVTMGSTAMVAALEKFGARKLAILTPHQPRGDEMVRAYFLEAGFEVVRLKGLKCATPRLIAQVPLADIRNALRELDGDDVEAMLTVGTAMPAASVAAEAERWLGKPVLAVNVVSFWHALRQCGLADRVYGQSRILEEF